jgi:predicted DNA-binding antitoxin AbrB/MazE fold protein
LSRRITLGELEYITMTQQVAAIYDHGVLRPLAPVNLRDNDQVMLTIEKSESSDTINSQPTLFEVLDGAGLIGAIKDAPSDLSANPGYMHGFGKSGE